MSRRRMHRQEEVNEYYTTLALRAWNKPDRFEGHNQREFVRGYIDTLRGEPLEMASDSYDYGRAMAELDILENKVTPINPRDIVMTKRTGGIIEHVKGLWSSLVYNKHLPKRFRVFMKQHGDEEITKIEMFRVPVNKLGTTIVNLITAGDWEGIKERSGVDKVFHTGMLINDKYTLEKLSKLEFREDVSYRESPEIEFYTIHPAKPVKISDFIEKAEKSMGENFYLYDFLKNNCQNFVSSVLSANGLLDEEARKWIKQDISKLIQETPSLSKYLGVKLTDTSRNIENVAEELFYRKGGRVRRKYM